MRFKGTIKQVKELSNKVVQLENNLIDLINFNLGEEKLKQEPLDEDLYVDGYYSMELSNVINVGLRNPVKYVLCSLEMIEGIYGLKILSDRRMVRHEFLKVNKDPLKLNFHSIINYLDYLDSLMDGVLSYMIRIYEFEGIDLTEPFDDSDLCKGGCDNIKSVKDKIGLRVMNISIKVERLNSYIGENNKILG